MRNHELDGLRGLACLIVVVGHAFGSSWAWVSWPGLMGGIPRIGVWLFFVLSAFLLTHRLLEESVSLVSLVRYTIARLTRIVPPFVIAVGFYRLIDPDGFETNSQMLCVLMLQAPYKHLWTIPVEMKFYLLLPFIVIALKKLTKAIGIYLTFLALAASLIAIRYYGPTVTVENYLSVAPYLVCFGAGVTAAWVTHFSPRPHGATGRICAYVAIFSIAALVLFNKTGYFGDFKSELARHHTTFGMLWAILIYGIYNDAGRWNSLFASFPLRKIGEISFSVYLFHWAFIMWTKDWFFPIGLISAVGFSLMIGFLSFHAFEKPLIGVRKLIFKRLYL
ncbi:acyltransferase family protein [Ochrobactrum quorumnocens]|uniref:Acyltransferase family protein n=1 Tax=Ochrobactrum quorumnocens TaxID=271865 RepID=A0A248UCU4_9HYPH|nr:acyltransferase [[Ochrobactrum] quorumnocens]ASV84518.1 acyltransferase family protein [[Ochrobactrum] quorumnocens]